MSDQRYHALNAPDVLTKPGHAGLHILVIDDEPTVGSVLRSMLGVHNVEVFERPSDALGRTYETLFDLVLCDLKMPEMTGLEVYEVIARTTPALAKHFVLMTGWADQATTDFLAARHLLLLTKPFCASELERCVREVAERS